ncbi:MAG: phosphoglycerate kinase [Planctomycetota bacterium]|jgi:phosphoglycerate kinase
MIQTIEDIDVRGQRVLVRLDLNVPLAGDGAITDDRRIRAALPTVRRLLADGGRLILMSHLGRPKSDADRRRLSLAPVAERMSELLDRPIEHLAHCRGEAVASRTQGMNDSDVVMLENLRFCEEETLKDAKIADDPALKASKDGFASELASLAEVYVNDAFGTCHRDNASMLTVPQQMSDKPRAIGYLVLKELEFLGKAVNDPARPFVCLLGGAKVSDKLGVIKSLLEKCDKILIGGAMAYTFLAAQGKATGSSLVEPDLFETALGLLDGNESRIMLPVDAHCADRIAAGLDPVACGVAIPDGLMGLDIGRETVKQYAEVLLGAGTIIWNGPMGVFEQPPFDAGTNAMAIAIADASERGGAVSIVGGGDSAAAVQQAGLADQMSHISTGGGASLEFLEGRPFAALEALENVCA